ncbi:MAG: hypothetical protein RLZZ164_930 [Actinomycetota bacterium]|jgi:YidC/Oxa1 family membrane protein insertase
MDLLLPVKWVIEAILVLFYKVFSFLTQAPDAGITWVLSIIGLVLVVRAALIPVFVRQIKSQRNMLVMQPELQKLQKKYKGKTDRESREKFAAEQMALYKRTGSNPLSSCLPLLLQMPIFAALFFTLNGAQHDKQGVAFLTAEMAKSFSSATLFGARLSETFLTAQSMNVQILAAVMVLVMTATQFITQKQILAKNQNPDVNNSQYAQTQKIMLYVFPVVFMISGISFPLGVMFYWLTSNFWTMGQQFLVIRNMPTPGSIAHRQREERLARKGKLKKGEPVTAADVLLEETEIVNTQREQPVGKKRAKKKG